MPGVRAERDRLSDVQADLRFAAIVAVVIVVFFQTPIWGVFSWALSAPFHEVGHTLAAWAVSRPALPSPFKAIIFTEERALWFFLLELGGCVFMFARGRREGEEMPLLVGIARTWGVVLVFCTFALRLDKQEQLIAWAGQAGEIVLPAAAVALALAYGSRLPWVYGTSDTFLQQHRVLLFWGATVFAASTTRWLSSLRNPTLVPFGGIGSEEGDLDLLKNDYLWTVSGFQRSYLWTALVSALFVAGVAAFHWQGRNGGQR